MASRRAAALAPWLTGLAAQVTDALRGATQAGYIAVRQWLEAQDLAPSGDPWESYLDGPDVPQPRTVVSAPCARRQN
jgi:hypothetical protein